MRKYILLLCLLWMNICCAQASQPDESDEWIQGRRVILNVLNMVPSEEIETLKNIVFFSGKNKKVYVLQNHFADQFNYTTNLELMVTIVQENGESYSKFCPMPAENGHLSFALPSPDQVKLDRITIQVLGVAFKALEVEFNSPKIQGDYQYVSLASAWHSFKPGAMGCLQKNTLNAYFVKEGHPFLQKQPYRIVFGGSLADAKY